LPNGRAIITQELQTAIETKAPIMEYFRSIAATGVMMAKPQEQKMPVVCPAKVRHDRKGDAIGTTRLFLEE
jgi:hypothetical protein